MSEYNPKNKLKPPMEVEKNKPKKPRDTRTLSTLANIKRANRSMGAYKSKNLMNADPQAHAIIIEHMESIRQIASRVNTKDVESMRNAFYEYLKLCHDQDQKVGNMSAYMAMGVHQSQISLWKSGKSDLAHQQLAEEVIQICGAYREQLMLSASETKFNPLIGIFWQKVFDKFDDKAVGTAEFTDLLGEKKSATQLQEEYGDLIDG